MTAKERRRSLLKYISAMEKVKPLEHMPVFKANTMKMAAEYFEVPEYDMYHCSCYISKEVKDYNIASRTYSDFADNGYEVESTGCKCNKVAKYGDFSTSVPLRGLLLLSDEAMFIFALTLKTSEIASEIRNEVERMQLEDEHEESEETVHEHNNENSHQQKSAQTGEIKIFNNSEFGSVRTVEENGKILFCGSDVAKALGYARPNDAISAHCRATVKRRTPISGKVQEINFISEGDIYRLAAKSKLPGADKFESWIFDEVLPSIRKHGAYMTPDTLQSALSSPESLIKILEALKAEQEKNRDLQTVNAALMKKAHDWDDTAILNALMRSYAVKMYNGIFSCAWGELYRNIMYRYHINLKVRKSKPGNEKRKYIDLIKPEEMKTVIGQAVALCEACGINTSRVINQVNFEKI